MEIDDNVGSVDEIAELFLKAGNEEPEVETDEEDSEVEAEEAEEGPEADADDESYEDAEGDEPEAEPDSDPDEAEYDVTVDGASRKVKLKDLKGLYATEQATTTKAQSVAAQARALEAQGLYLAKLLDARQAAAKAKFDKYAEVDLFTASRKLDDDEFAVLKKAKEAAEAEWTTINAEAKEFIQRANQTRQEVLRERAKAALSVVTKAIPEWSDELYGKLRTYAVSQGMAADDANETVDPAVFVLMHKAMKYDDAQKKTEAVVKKVTKAPAKVAKKGVQTTNVEASKVQRIRAKAINSGSVDDVTEAFLAALKS